MLAPTRIIVESIKLDSGMYSCRQSASKTLVMEGWPRVSWTQLLERVDVKQELAAILEMPRCV